MALLDIGPNGEMPFLEHLEELRVRLFWCIGALVVGMGLGFFVVMHFNVIALLQKPIEPFLHGAKLVYTHPGDPFNIVLNAAIAVGVVLALPVVGWQLWAFLAPALFDHEKKVILPVFFGAILLFLAGAAMAYFAVIPLALEWLIGFQSESLQPMITAGEYFSFVISLVLAFGLAFELPIVILALAAFGVVNARMLGKFRRHAFVGAVIAGAFLTPGDLIWTTIAMTVPLYGLYELSIALSWLIERRRRRRAVLGEREALA